jgi:hypothetical protein
VQLTSSVFGSGLEVEAAKQQDETSTPEVQLVSELLSLELAYVGGGSALVAFA